MKAQPFILIADNERLGCSSKSLLKISLFSDHLLKLSLPNWDKGTLLILVRRVCGEVVLVGFFLSSGWTFAGPRLRWWPPPSRSELLLWRLWSFWAGVCPRQEHYEVRKAPSLLIFYMSLHTMEILIFDHPGLRGSRYSLHFRLSCSRTCTHFFTESTHKSVTFSCFATPFTSIHILTFLVPLLIWMIHSNTFDDTIAMLVVQCWLLTACSCHSPRRSKQTEFGFTSLA